MKKRLLLVLTIVMLMVVAAFSINAANTCAPGEHKIKLDNGVRVCETCGKTKWCAAGSHVITTKRVAPTCEDRGYDVTYCAVCGEDFAENNHTLALGHDWVNDYKNEDPKGSGKILDYFYNRRTCQRCKDNEIESVENNHVKYYSVQFINAKATGAYLNKVVLDDGTEVGVKHAKLTGAWYNQALNSVAYVQEGGSYTFDGKKPTRNKDLEAGEYNFVGWTDVVIDGEVKDTDVTPTEDKKGLNITVKGINKNIVYYACWQSKVVTYKVQFVNYDGSSWISTANKEVEVAHGFPIDYRWIYPSKDSTTSSDYKFAGWVCGNPSKTDAEGKYTEYDEYRIEANEYNEKYDEDLVHIKNVPIYSDDAMKATYTAVPRKYVVEFDLKNGNAPFQTKVDFGQRLDLNKVQGENSYTLTLDGVTYTVPGEYTDSTYTYLFESGFETTTGHLIKNHSFSVPVNTLDHNDSIFLVYASDMSTMVQADGKDMVLVKEINDDIRNARYPNEPYDYTKKTLYDCFIEEYNYYNNCKANVLPYTPKYFNLNTTTYLFLKSEHGKLLVDEKGNYVTLEISLNGIYRTYVTGAREKIISGEDSKEKFNTFADGLRTVKVEPSYRSIITMNNVVFEIIMPVRINGKEVEDSPAHFNDLLTVQVKNQNGKLIGRATTGNSNKKEHEAFNFTDDRGNEYRKFFCVMSLEKADRYEIVVASNDGRNKYEGTRTLFWSTYESLKAEGKNVVVDLSVSADYNQGLNCYCLCHGPLKGLWARILNILYSLFKMQHECCPHMHAEIGDILAY